MSIVPMRACARKFCPRLMAISLAVGVAVVGFAQEPISTAEILNRAKLTPRLGNTVPPDLPFEDSDGGEVSIGECFAGRPIALHLIYFGCPMLCRMSRDNFLESLDQLKLTVGEDFDVVTVSFDPREDSSLAARVKDRVVSQYQRPGSADGWRFLTGEKTSIDALCESVGFRYAWNEITGQYAHGAGLFVLTGDGKVSRFLGGVKYAPRDLRLAIVEASEGDIGTAADEFLLLCYMYDPTEGRYGFAIITALRSLGLATVLVLGFGIGMMLRRDRRRLSVSFSTGDAGE